MVMEIERLWSWPLGSFVELPSHQRARLLAWYRVHIDPSGEAHREARSSRRKAPRRARRVRHGGKPGELRQVGKTGAGKPVRATPEGLSFWQGVLG